MTPTIDEQRARIQFNPSNSDKVFAAKQQCAVLINAAEELKRLCALAATAFEEGGMWLVKALTFQPIQP
jgi:hypothetical protein